LLGERTITIDCDVLVADGGTRTASITGAYVALADAVASLQAKGDLEGSPLVSEVAAISVGVLGDVPVLDLDYAEDVAVEVDMNVVMTGAGGLVEVQGTAEGSPFDRALLDGMLDLAAGGIAGLVDKQRAVLAEG
ncbi:MAG: ribonuclease PH, partial [Actinomycetota bacterium]